MVGFEKIMKLLMILIVSLIVCGEKIFAHAGHDDAPSEQATQNGPLVLSPEAKQNLEIQTAEVTVQAMEKTIKSSGTIQAIAGTRENVSSKIAGRVVDIMISLGQTKKKGETLLLIESSQLSETPIRIAVAAPRNGKVVKLKVIKGDAVEIGTSLLEIADYGEVYAVAQVYEAQIGKIKKGMSARIYSPGLKNKDLASKVEIVGTEVNTQSRTVDVWLRAKNNNEQLKINMTVNVFFLTDKEDESIVVPKMAVLGSGGERFVFVEDGNNYTRTSIVTGIENDKWIEAVEGLSPGDIVVTQGNYQLQFAKAKVNSAHNDKNLKTDSKAK